jgi:membrane protease YdiL (CAAX protease family)
MAVSLFVSLSIVVVFSFLLGFNHDTGTNTMQEQFERLALNSNIQKILLLMFFEIILIIFGPWHWYSVRKGEMFSPREAMTANNLFMAVLIGFFTQIFSGAIITVIYVVMPSWVDHYSKIMEDAFATNTSPLLVFMSVVIIGPIAEELLFRGMIFRVLRKGFSLYIAAFVSSLFFSVYHMNIVQGIYAFFIGFLLCVLYEKTQTFWYTAVVHIIFNGSSFFVQWVGEEFGEMSEINTIILWVLSLGIISSAVQKVSVNRKVLD